MKIKKRKLMGLCGLVIMILFSFIPSSSSIASNKENLAEKAPYVFNDLIDHPEIVITTDEDFGPSGLNFPGMGMPGDPYLIEGYNITSVGPFGILIDASGGSNPFNVSFIIRDCWITAIEVCIKIVDAYPDLVTIDNCTCVNTLGGDGIGIYLINCDGATVINCRCNYNFHVGMKFDLSTSLWIGNNICYQNGDEGIFIDNASSDGLLINNTCEKNVWGIKSEFSNSNTFRYNNCTDNSYAGFGLYYGNWLVVENNTALKNNNFGFQILSCDYGVLMFNHIEETTFYGVYLEASVDYCTLHHNNFIGNNAGGSSQSENHAVVTTQNATWYDTATNEGNYWDDYVGPGVYNIDGTALNFDPYPLSSPVTEIIPEYSYVIWGLALLSLIGLVTIFLRKR